MQFEVDPKILAAAARSTNTNDAMLQLCIAIQQIAAPTGQEEARARWVAEQFSQVGLTDVAMDAERNVYARLPGQDPQAKALLVSAHTDTVFPMRTDLSVRSDDESGRVYGPGIGDNSAGVASLLWLARTWASLPAPQGDIWFVANSGEEGLGDLRGMRAAMDRLGDRVGACIVIEGLGLGRIVHRALGSRRYRIRAHAPGGHSWSDFGTASAIHALSLLAAEIVRIKPPTSPRTTYNIGRFTGGTSINTIAQEAALELDLRSEDQGALQALIDDVHAIVLRFQSNRWQRWGVQIEMETIGDRPSGAIAAEHPMVLAASHALAVAGLTEPADLRISSTDANIPLSRNIPAVCVGVTRGGNAHRQEEWLEPKLFSQGLQHLLVLSAWTSQWLATTDDQTGPG